MAHYCKSTIYLEQSINRPDRKFKQVTLKGTLFLIVLFCFQHFLTAQVIDSISSPDTTIVMPDSLADTEVLTLKKNQGKEALTSRVEYKAKDSMRFVLDDQLVFMYNECDLKYEKIILTSDFVQINFDTKILYASGLPDSSGKITGNPKFSEDGEEFRAKQMRYNFDTKKGLISEVITQEGDGYLHGEVIKKMPNDEINISHGKYTTCDLEHPHFEFRFTKSKVIPNNKIITGPAYLVIEQVPTPLVIPFGLFPNKKGQRNGILIPSYGETANRGFYFENFGYYLGISDYLDLEIRGDIYTRGSWALKTKSSYNKRYKYRGSVGLRYAVNITGDQGSVDYSKSRDYAINWSHQQSDKARPNSKFTANVNIVSSKFNQYNPSSANDYLSNTFQSSIAYQTSFAGKYFLTATLNHRQNVINHSFDLTLPELSFSANRFYPFRSKQKTGRLKWYDNISIQYKMNAKNELNTFDTLLFDDGMWDLVESGVKHSIPVSSSIKVMKYFNLTNSINYTERWYMKKVAQSWNDDTLISGNDTTVGYLQKDTSNGFYSVRDFGFASNLSTRLYGMYQIKKGPVAAIRHVITPTIGLSYRPDFAKPEWGYYDTYVDGNGNEKMYSYYSGFIYNTAPSGESGRINFSLGNNLEMKVRSKKDTITGTKKVVLIESLSLATSYDLAKDSLRWSPLSVSARTRLFKNFDVSYAGNFDPYIIDSTGRKKDQFEWVVNKRLFRFTGSSWNFSLNWRLNSDTKNAKKNSEKGTEEELDMINDQLDNYVDFNIPWNLTLSYSLRYVTTVELISEKRDAEIVQTLSFNGDVNITPKWKFGFRSGYDFEAKDFSYTSVDIYRDLHCWEMRFNWIPIGPRKSWNFSINVKSAMLQDLKLNRKKDFRDY